MNLCVWVKYKDCVYLFKLFKIIELLEIKNFVDVREMIRQLHTLRFY